MTPREKAMRAIETWGGKYSHPDYPRLITIHNSAINDDALELFEHLEGLRELSLLGCKNVTDDGVAHLKGLTSLNKLALSGTQVSDDGLKYLVDMKNLEILMLQQTNVTDEGVAELQAALPDCEIKK